MGGKITVFHFQVIGKPSISILNLLLGLTHLFLTSAFSVTPTCPSLLAPYDLYPRVRATEDRMSLGMVASIVPVHCQTRCLPSAKQHWVRMSHLRYRVTLTGPKDLPLREMNISDTQMQQKLGRTRHQGASLRTVLWHLPSRHTPHRCQHWLKSIGVEMLSRQTHVGVS